VLTEDAVYLFTGSSIYSFPPGTCDVAGLPLTIFANEPPMEVAPALHDGVIYLPFGPRLYAISVETLGSASFARNDCGIPSSISRMIFCLSCGL
jgi:hypothetical protein